MGQSGTTSIEMKDGQIGFFEDSDGVRSMSRVGMAINLAVASFVTIYLVIKGTAGEGDHILLIFGLWAIAYGGKNAAKYLENIKPKKNESK